MLLNRRLLFSRLCAALLLLTSLVAQAADTAQESADRRAQALFDAMAGDWVFNARLHLNDRWIQEIGLLSLRSIGPGRMATRESARTILPGENLANETEGGFHASMKTLQWDTKRQRLVRNASGRETVFELTELGYMSDTQLPAGALAANGIKQAVRLKETYVFVGKDQFVGTMMAIDAAGETVFQSVVVVTRMAANGAS